MATAGTTYGPSGVTTATQADPYFAGDDTMINFFNEMARRRAAVPAARGNPMGGRTVHARSRTRAGEGDSTNALRDKLLRAKVGEAAAQAQAASSPMPTRLHPGGAGFTSAFSTPDHLAMTGAQRAAFLPGNASFQNSPGGGSSKPAPRVYGGPGSAFADAGEEEDFWRNQAIKAQAMAAAKR
jgi:hypothetical protein